MALKNLSEGVALFKQTMGTYWKQTAVLVLTEFGRTVMMNDINGSDHGTGTVGFLIGGNVQGGQIIGDWPGLAKKDLYQERDLYPANDVRKLIKAVLKDHLQISDALIEETILPESHETRAFMNLFYK